MMKCTDCKYCVEQDNGYSNYTVEGTEADCLLSKNPDFPSDRWYHEDEALNYASECASFTKGDSVHFDVEGETTVEDYKEDDEIYRLLLLWNK
jgi:hypothetical protein